MMKILLLLMLVSSSICAESIFVTGEIESRNTQEVLMPAVPSFNGKISEMVPEGTQVNKGDFLLSIDGSSIDSQIESQAEELETFKASAQKSVIDLEIELNQAKLGYEQAKTAYKIAQMKAEVPNEYIGDLAYKENQLTLKNAEKSYKKAQNDLQEVRIKIKKNEEEVSLGIKQKQGKLNHLQSTLDLYTINAEQQGYIIYSTKSWTGEKIQVGDQMNSGQKIMSVSQNKDLQVVAWINAIDIPKLQENQPVKIQFDAFMDKIYRGKIIQIASGGEDRKIWGDGLYYKVSIDFSQQPPSNLLLGMSTLIEISINKM